MRILSLIAAGLAAPLVLTLVAAGGSGGPDGGLIGQLQQWRGSGDAVEMDNGARFHSEPRSARQAIHYTVQPGDTLSSVARLFSVSVDALLAVNLISDPDHLVAGTRLMVPLDETDAVSPAAPSDSMEGILWEAEREFDLPPGLLLALAWQESGWSQDVISPAGAVGVAQILPSTAEWAQETLLNEELDWRGDARDNARLGAAYLRHLLDSADGDVWWAVAAYYQGWRGVETHGVYDETRQYVRNVLALMARFQPGGE